MAIEGFVREFNCFNYKNGVVLVFLCVCLSGLGEKIEPILGLLLCYKPRCISITWIELSHIKFH
jgi:hypothetical protein